VAVAGCFGLPCSASLLADSEAEAASLCASSPSSLSDADSSLDELLDDSSAQQQYG